MAVPQEEDKRTETSSPWDKSWVFFLAFLCLVSLAGLGTWGRVRMLQDDNDSLQKKLQDEKEVHLHEEMVLNSRLQHRRKLFGNLRQALDTQMAVSSRHLQKLNATVKDVKAHVMAAVEKVSEDQSHLLSECQGVTLPRGFQYTPEDQVIFPHDVAHDTLALDTLVNGLDDSVANKKAGLLQRVTKYAESAKLFNRPTFPWSQWTWLSVMLEYPDLSGNFTEWGLGAGGSAMFLGALASVRGSSMAGFDAWKTDQDRAKHLKQFADAAQQSGLSMPKDVEIFDLNAKAVTWPGAGGSERLAFTHIDSDDYQTILGVLQVVYGSTVDGGIIAVDNFFHPSGGSKRAVEEFFRKETPGKLPLIYPVFPGRSVLIFKGHYANTTTDAKNALDGNYYSFKYIKGQNDILSSVGRSVTKLSAVHKSVKNDPKRNANSFCWLSLALNNARNLYDFIQSSDEGAEDFEAENIFRFMADSSLFSQSLHVA